MNDELFEDKIKIRASKSNRIVLRENELRRLRLTSADFFLIESELLPKIVSVFLTFFKTSIAALILFLFYVVSFKFYTHLMVYRYDTTTQPVPTYRLCSLFYLLKITRRA